MIKDYLKILLPLFIIWCSPAGSQSLSFRHYDKGEGLNNGFIYTTHQDNRGFIWIATGNGFQRFDGQHFSLVKSLGSGINLVTVTFTDS